MALLYDDKESQDKRLQILLSTAVNLQQIKQQKDIADQSNQTRLMMLANQVQLGKNKSGVDYAKLGMAPVNQADLPRVQNEQNMMANPNRGSLIQDSYGQSFQPNSRLEEMAKSGKGGTPRFMQDENGNMVPLPGILVETPQQKMDRKQSGSTSDQKNALQANQSAAIVFGELQRMSQGLEKLGGYEGLAIKSGNVLTRGKANPQVEAYKSFMPAAGVSLYRGITGDTRLSDADAASRAYPLVWDIGTDGAVKGIKEKNIQNLLSARNILLSNNVYATNKNDKITSLEDVQFVANAVNHGATEDEIIGFLKAKRKQ